MKHQAWILRGWEDVSITRVLIARERGASLFEIGGFLVDRWCLGVKDAYATEISTREFAAFLAKAMPEEECETLEPACARKLVEGAVAYAQNLGFLPHRDFRKARKVLGGIDAAACPREFVFGKDGKPFFMAGSYDDEVRINRVLTILRARLGEDGFHFAVPEEIDDGREGEDADVAASARDHDDGRSPTDDASGTELDGVLESSISIFYDFLASRECPDGAMVPPSADGFLTGICMLPEEIPAAEWRPIVFGFEPSSTDLLQRIEPKVIVGLAGSYAMIVTSLQNGDYEPMLLNPRHPNHYAAAREFCQGFVLGLALRTAARARLLAAPETAAAFATIERIAFGDATTDAELEAWRATQTNMAIVVGRSIRVLYSTRQNLRPSLPPPGAAN